MKKRILFSLLLVVALVGLTACGKKKEYKDILDAKEAYMGDEAKEVFSKGLEGYTPLEVEPVALLAKQVVAGTNYMFLAKGHEKGVDTDTYKIIVIYKSLEDKYLVTSSKDLDYVKYTKENKDYTDTEAVGAWEVVKSGDAAVLDKKIQTAFDKATSTLVGMSYTPIAALGQKGDDYAILCYATPTVPEAKTYVYLLVVNEDELVTTSYIDLADYNQ